MSICKIFSWAAVVLWMFMIFNMSGQIAEESNELSTGITQMIVDTLEKVVPSTDLDIYKLNHIIRKNAHFFVYMILGVLVINALKQSGVLGYKSAGIAFLICVLYAVSDEVHQLYVPGRGGQVQDVLIDSSGALAGLLLYLLICRRKSNPQKE